MKETTKGDALSVLEIMEEKGWTKDEIRELVTYLDQSITQPLETMIFWWGVFLAILILTCPGALPTGLKKLFFSS